MAWHEQTRFGGADEKYDQILGNFRDSGGSCRIFRFQNGGGQRFKGVRPPSELCYSSLDTASIATWTQHLETWTPPLATLPWSMDTASSSMDTASSNLGNASRSLDTASSPSSNLDTASSSMGKTMLNKKETRFELYYSNYFRSI